MRNWSIPVGRVFGVEIRIHLTFLALLLFVWLTQSGKDESPGRAFALVGIIFGAVVVHELAHALTAMRSGLDARAIILLPIGGITVIDQQGHEEPAREMRVALAGPFANLVVAVIAAGVLLSVAPEIKLTEQPLVHSGHLLRSLVWANLFLGAFNLLPAYPMDGGRVLRAFFARRMDPARATRLAVTVGQAFAAVFIFVGVWNTWLMLVGLFLFVGAQIEDRTAVFHQVLESMRMEDVMLTDFSTLSPADTLEYALAKAVHTLQDDFPVVRGSDMVGVISKQGILQALRSEGNGYVQPVMNRMFEASQPGDSLASAFRKITSRGLTMILVVDGGHLVGIVTLQNLMHSMSLLAESRKLRQPAEK